MTDDITAAIAPKSDQLNADDLLTGPITVVIDRVDVKEGEQPVTVHLIGRKPWKPCKSMGRVLAAAWGPRSSAWGGRSVTLYCDPKVQWGGMAVGGIRVSHMSHIAAPMKLALTATKGKKTIFEVKPLAVSDPLVDALREIGATIEQADQWCATVNKPPLSTADANTRAKAANHFRNNPGLLVQKAASAGESE